MINLRKANLLLKVGTFLKIPLLFSAGPKILEMTDKRCVLRLKLRRKTKNHLGSMYFGALNMGGEAAAGFIIIHNSRTIDPKVSLIVKDFRADYIKKATSDVYFVCDDIPQINEAFMEVSKNTGKKAFPVTIKAHILEDSQEIPVAEFNITMSLYKK